MRTRRRRRPGASAAPAGATARSSSGSRRGCERGPSARPSSASHAAPPAGWSAPGNLHSAVEAYLVAGRVALGSRPAARRRRRRSPAAASLARERAGARAPPRPARRRAGRARRAPSGRDAWPSAAPGCGTSRSTGRALPTIELRALASGHGAELGEIGLGVVPRRGLARPGPRVDGADAGGGAARRRLPASDVADRRPSRRPSAGPADVRPTGRGIAAADERRRAVSAEDWARTGRASRRRTQRAARAAAWRRSARRSTGATLVEFGKFEGRLVAVVVEPRRARLVELGAEAGRRAPSCGRCSSRCAGWPTRAAAPRRTPRARAPTCASPACGTCCSRRSGSAPDDELVVVPVGPAARRAVVLPARRPARPGAVGDVLGPHAPRRAGTATAAAGRSSSPVRT